MTLWKYIEAHHEEFGVALFIVPTLAAASTVLAVGWAVAELLSRL